MTITDLTVIPIVVPLQRTFHGSNYSVSQRATLLVRIVTDAGVIGEAFVGDERTHYRQLAGIVTEGLRNRIVGRPLHQHERLWASMFALTHAERDKGLALRAVSAVDVAMWDAIGKSTGLSLTRLLGGHHDSLPIVAFQYGPDDQPVEALVDEVAGLMARGYAGIKLKVARGAVAVDVERVHALRRALGPGLLLGCDANRNWSFHDALEFATHVEDARVDWLEEPVHWHAATEDLARLRAKTRIPVAAGQSEATVDMSHRMVRAGAVDLLNSDVALIGGVTAWKRLAAAVSFDAIGMLHHEETHIACHLLTAVPHGRVIEVHADPIRDPVWHHMITNPPVIRDGHMIPPDRPGLGFDIDPDFVERYAVRL